MAEKKVSKTINDDGTISFEFATGETEVVNPSDFSSEIQAQLTLHGASQKLGDSYSGEDADKCHAVFMGVLKNLTDGNWSARSGGGGAPRVSQLAEALALETGKTVEECVEKLSGLDDEKKKAVRAHPAIQARLAEIKLRKAQEAAEKAKEELGDADAPSLNF